MTSNSEHLQWKLPSTLNVVYSDLTLTLKLTWTSIFTFASTLTVKINMNVDFFPTGGAWASCVDLPSSSDTVDINLLVRRAGGRRKVRQAGSTPVVAVRDSGNLSFNRCKSYIDWTTHRFYRAIMSVQYRIVQYRTVQYRTVQYSTLQNSTLQYRTVHYSTVQNSTVHCSTVQNSTVQCNSNIINMLKGGNPTICSSSV